MDREHHVVIIGGGFGGLYAAQSLKRAPVRLTLVDRHNYHLFQPLLYQVATGGLSAGNIATPLRTILDRQRNARVMLAEVCDFDLARRQVILTDGRLEYDSLIVAGGSETSYFGRDDWAGFAPGLKSIEDATDIRRRIFLAFEAAERETDPERVAQWLTFVVVGGGPTGVELAGALAEIARHTLRHEFRAIDPGQAKILLLEGTDRILPAYPPELSARARRQLEGLGVVVRTQTLMTEIGPDTLALRQGDHSEELRCRTVIWAAGVKASPLGAVLARAAGVVTDRPGRVPVAPDLTLPGYPEVFVIGDLANFSHQDEGQPLPGVAPVAMQQGRYAARLIKRRLNGQSLPPFRYRDRGTMATVGRNRAVAIVKGWKFSGYFAWLLWLFVHLMYIVEFQNRLLVAMQWAWNYFTWNRGARLITGKNPLPLVTLEPAERAASHDDPAPSTPV